MELHLLKYNSHYGKADAVFYFFLPLLNIMVLIEAKQSWQTLYFINIKKNAYIETWVLIFTPYNSGTRIRLKSFFWYVFISLPAKLTVITVVCCWCNFSDWVIEWCNFSTFACKEKDVRLKSWFRQNFLLKY